MDHPGDTSRLEFGRIIGFDVARSIAILAIFIVHFCLTAAEDRAEPAWLAGLLGFFDGRASATFMILAGISVTLMSRRSLASNDSTQVAKMRMTLVRRGICLLVLGFINLIIWPGDILRVYGVSLFIAAVMLTATNRQLLLTAGVFALVFAWGVLSFDFNQAWEWETLTYHGLWTPTGILRNLFFDGFRSVFPWTGFMLYGMWLGRLELGDSSLRRRVLITAMIFAVTAELVSSGLVHGLTSKAWGWDVAPAKWLFGTESMPALPLFLLAAGATATSVIVGCVALTIHWPSWWWSPFAVTGQMALTWYFAHIVIGLGTIVVLDQVETESLPVAAGYGVFFFVLAMVVSMLWKRYWSHGPLEMFLRAVG